MPTGSTQQQQAVPTVIVEQKKGPGCLIQAIWFLFVGWWLGAVLISIAWFLNVIVVGLPLGMAILNNIPKILALQEPTTHVEAITAQGKTVLRQADLPQRNFWLRAAYFILVGWWWSGIWLALAYVLCATIIFMPVGLNMFRMTPAMTTLRRY